MEVGGGRCRELAGHARLREVEGFSATETVEAFGILNGAFERVLNRYEARVRLPSWFC
jgi:hypothetical protein